MAMEGNYICCVLYHEFPITNVWVQPFWKLVLKYASEMGQEVTDFDFGRFDRSGTKNGYRYIKRNLKHLLAKEVDKEFRLLDFYCVGNDKDYSMSPVKICLSNRYYHINRGMVLMQCQEDLFNKIDSMSNFFRHFIEDVKTITNIKYGIIHIMKGNKHPYLYFEDIPGANLTKEEKINLKIWDKEGHRFQTVVRDIYWGNVLTRSHWGNEKSKEKYLLAELKHECESSVCWIDEETLFFCAPFNICPQDNPEMQKFRKQLYKLFDECKIEVIGANLDKYLLPQQAPSIDLLKKDASKKTKKLRSKKKLIIRYCMVVDSEETEEHKYVSEILRKVGPLSLTIEKETRDNDIWATILVEGKKVPEVRRMIVTSVENMDMDFKLEPPLDEEDIRSLTTK